ncbi:hypothetical protein [Halorubrum ezzemoulense]|uniref:hypothetical protein n=1 Tax=Halorubrum ezzemoulense TaxID=337243 RepID=UPI0015957BDC|nr:hypothetical protein [Halorubrum ezzemoulense]
MTMFEANIGESILTATLLTVIVVPLDQFTQLGVHASAVVAIVAILFLNILYWKVRGYSVKEIYFGRESQQARDQR